MDEMGRGFRGPRATTRRDSREVHSPDHQIWVDPLTPNPCQIASYYLWPKLASDLMFFEWHNTPVYLNKWASSVGIESSDLGLPIVLCGQAT